MISSKIITTLYVVTLLFSAVLAGSANTECNKNAASLIKKFNVRKVRFVVLLEDKKDLEQHLKFFKGCWGLDSESALDVDNSTKEPSKNKISHFSVGRFSGYIGFFNTPLVKQIKLLLPNVKIVKKESKVKAFSPIKRDTTTTEFYDLDRIDQRKRPLDGKFNFPSPAGQNVHVYVIDTGINPNKTEFGDRVRIGGVFCAPCSKKDDNGHGTAVASLVGGINFGVAKKVNLIAVKVLDKNGSGTNLNVILGMLSVLKEHLEKKKNTVVNMSLGGGADEAIDFIVKVLTDNGIHVIVAAGNEGRDACKTSPARAPSAITAGATEDTTESITNFSNFGPCVDIFAPGRNVPVLFVGRSTLSGTSFSSPLTAGVVAVIISNSGNLIPKEMAERVISESTKGVVKNLPNDTKNRFLFLPQS